jgi:hypothetical protein
MEDASEVYPRPYDETRPVVCLGEQPVPLIGETRTPLPAAPGRPERVDFEYRRNGSANLFLAFAPLLGWRAVRVTDRRTAKDFADFLQGVVDDGFPEADRVVPVTDNRNVHAVGSLSEAFAPAEARRIAGRIEWPSAPEHGSRLNLAECEFAALSGHCLGRRIGEAAELRRQVDAWVEDRNHRGVEAAWRFTTADARIKLRRLYPSTR